MSLQSCAEMVRRGDPDRFRATMSVPPAARAVLFPLYAFNLEISRAPWVTAEPLIAEMRLQFWRDTVEEIGQGGPPRAHEVAEPLAAAMDRDPAAMATALDQAIAGRFRDIDAPPFEDDAAFAAYLDQTSGGLTWAAAIGFGAPEDLEGPVRDAAWAGGLARWFLAIPELEARGRRPLADGRPEAVAELAREGLRRLRTARRTDFGAATPALRAFWQDGAILKQAADDPRRVADGTLGLSAFRQRGGLLFTALKGGW